MIYQKFQSNHLIRINWKPIEKRMVNRRVEVGRRKWKLWRGFSACPVEKGFMYTDLLQAFAIHNCHRVNKGVTVSKKTGTVFNIVYNGTASTSGWTFISPVFSTFLFHKKFFVHQIWTFCRIFEFLGSTLMFETLLLHYAIVHGFCVAPSLALIAFAGFVMC